MLFLRPNEKGTAFEYRTGDDGLVIELDVEYKRDGMGGWFGGTARPRGIYVDVTPVTYEKREGYTSKMYTIGGPSKVSGAFLLIEPLNRASPKKLLAAATFLDEVVPAIALQWREEMATARQLLIEKVEEYQRQAGIAA